jgi:hypothetical protein
MGCIFSLASFLKVVRKSNSGNIFGQYIPRELVDEMSQSDEEFTLAGESCEMTVFLRCAGFHDYFRKNGAGRFM